MRSLLSLILLSFLIPQLAKGQNNIEADEPAGDAKIYLFRPSDPLRENSKIKILANEKVIVLLKSGSFFEYTAPPGNYTFSMTFNPKSRVAINAQAGGEYFIICEMSRGAVTAMPILRIVERLSFDSLNASDDIDEQGVKIFSLEKYFSEHGSFNLGVKAYSVDYNIEKNRSEPDYDSRYLSSLKGSGVDLIAGIFLKF